MNNLKTRERRRRSDFAPERHCTRIKRWAILCPPPPLHHPSTPPSTEIEEIRCQWGWQFNCYVWIFLKCSTNWTRRLFPSPPSQATVLFESELALETCTRLLENKFGHISTPKIHAKLYITSRNCTHVAE